jgi:hypothetical protein
MSHLNRRDFLGSIAAGAALVGGLGRLTQAQAVSAAAELTPGVPAGLSSYVTIGCPCRKLNPDVSVVQSAQNWHRQYATE